MQLTLYVDFMQVPASKAVLTIPILIAEAALFSQTESIHDEPSLFGVTDGKAVGTYLEHKFTAHLLERYSFAGGNSASGIDQGCSTLTAWFH